MKVSWRNEVIFLQRKNSLLPLYIFFLKLLWNNKRRYVTGIKSMMVRWGVIYFVGITYIKGLVYRFETTFSFRSKGFFLLCITRNYGFLCKTYVAHHKQFNVEDFNRVKKSMWCEAANFQFTYLFPVPSCDNDAWGSYLMWCEDHEVKSNYSFWYSRDIDT